MKETSNSELNPLECAAMGADTVNRYIAGEYMCECNECKTAIRCDLIDDSFFGFESNCPISR